MKKHDPISKEFAHIFYGADYNPEQWKDTPQILDEDMRLMKLAHVNSLSMGIFSWSELEPEEGKYDFSFLDAMMDRIYKNGGRVVLATPSGARPRWLAQKYPEVLRTREDRVKMLYGERHNHCFTSPVYREKTAAINRLLAERYKDHPALIVWHISNEYGGECHCPLCQEAFRSWLKRKYEGDLDRLNFQWWSTFWSHRYTSWDQVESPSSIGDTILHAQNLDWKRFVTDQTTDFMLNEIAPLRELTPDIPVTTNMMGTYEHLNYWKMAEKLDLISWDSYPMWHSTDDDSKIASDVAFMQDLNRSFKQKPFMLMESTPSTVDWCDYAKLKRPGMNKLSSIQAVAHGADAVHYFQWRKSRGSNEKFHGAVVDHCGHENTRVFREVSELGTLLEKLDGVVGTNTNSEVAIIYDWENRWALDDTKGFHRPDKKYLQTCLTHYRTFWENGVNVDIIDMNQDLSKYKLVIAPMLYMTPQSVIDRLKAYVENGGTLVGTYMTGLVNENDLCYLGGFPGGGLMDVFGIWAEETDTLYPQDRNAAVMTDGRVYEICDYCEVIHPAQDTDTLATYQQDYYQGMPALCKHSYGNGTAYYIAFRDTGAFTKDFHTGLIAELQLEKAVQELPYGVTAHTREGDGQTYLFVENYNRAQANVHIDYDYTDLETGTNGKAGVLKLEPYGVKILELK